MTEKEALKLALEAWPCVIAKADFSENTVTLVMQCTDYKVSSGNHWLSTTQPQRTWVGLTDEDKKQIAKEANYNWEMTTGEYAERIGRLTEANLKEKNT